MPKSAQGRHPTGNTVGNECWEGSADVGPPKLLDLSDGLFRGTGIVYYHIGMLPLGFQRFLNALTSRKILLAPTAGPRPGQPQ
jgi:hypothetical protein